MYTGSIICTHRVGSYAIVLQADLMVLPPSQILGAEYLADDRVSVI